MSDFGESSELCCHDYLSCSDTNGKDDIILKQFVLDVLDFSSQYGSDISISYTAYNLSGKPSKYPDYGDFPQTFVVRTYGKWWNEAPSRPMPIMSQNFGPIVSQDYIDLSFQVAVCPFQVCIYETYNPGSVVRIWAGDRCGTWEILWEGSPQTVNHSSRIFSPNIRAIKFPTKLIRLEFDQSNLDYYTQLDAVLLIGTREPLSSEPLSKLQDESFLSQKQENSFLSQRSENSSLNQNQLQRNTNKLYRTPFSNLRSRDLDKLLKNLDIENTSNLPDVISCDKYNSILPINLTPFSNIVARDLDKILNNHDTETKPIKIGHEDVTRCDNGFMSILPDETVLYIFSYLDLISLCRVAQLNRHFHLLATDSLLYTSLNLKPYWNHMNNSNLLNLTSRATFLQKLDLSWCGNYNQIDVKSFIRMIEENGKLLTHLRLDCCKFIDNICIEKISSICRNLKEISLRNCSKIDSKGFSYISTLQSLHRIDLYRSSIETSPLVNILKSSPYLKHINLGSCVKVSSMDEVAQALGQYNLELISVDFWKTYSLTPVGVRALSNCKKLQEVDFGWCLGVSIPGDCLSILASSCPNLRKLFMVALRGILDKDLDPFIDNCPRLEQVDLLGVRSISQEVCLRFLTKCPELKLLDISFCDNITDNDVLKWQKRFPHISIKRSFQKCTGIYTAY